MIDIFLWHPNHISWYDIISTHGTSFSGHEVEFVVRYTISVFTKINLPTPIEISWSFRVLYFHICCSKHAIERWFDLVGISFYNLTIFLDLPWAFRVLYVWCAYLFNTFSLSWTLTKRTVCISWKRKESCLIQLHAPISKK